MKHRTREKDLEGHIIDCENFGSTLHERGAHAEAEPYLREALQLAKSIRGYEQIYIADYHRWLAEIAWKAGRFAEAEREYADALPLYAKLREPREKEVLAAQVRLLVHQLKLPEALAALTRFQQFKQLTPADRAWTLHLETLIRALSSDAKGAESAALRLSEEFGATTDYPVAQYRARAAATCSAALAERELPRLDEAMKKHMRNPGLHITHALCLYRLGRYDELLSFNKKVMGLWSQNGSVLVALAEHRKHRSQATRHALGLALQKAEEYLKNHRDGKMKDLRHSEAPLYLDLNWLVSHARAELSSPNER
jgi:hypothetical protein